MKSHQQWLKERCVQAVCATSRLIRPDLMAEEMSESQPLWSEWIAAIQADAQAEPLARVKELEGEVARLKNAANFGSPNAHDAGGCGSNPPAAINL